MASGFLISDRTVSQVRGIQNRLMDYTCTVKRPGASPGRDSDNQPIEAGWDTVLTGQPCKLAMQSNTVNTGEQQSQDVALVVNRYKVSFPHGTDVLITDRIYDLKDRDGNEVDATVDHYEIKELIPDRFKLSLAVEAIH